MAEGDKNDLPFVDLKRDGVEELLELPEAVSERLGRRGRDRQELERQARRLRMHRTKSEEGRSRRSCRRSRPQEGLERSERVMGNDGSQLLRRHSRYAGVSFFCSSGLEETDPQTRRRPAQEEEEWEETEEKEEEEETDCLFDGTLDDAAVVASAEEDFSEVSEVDQEVEVTQELRSRRLRLRRRRA